MTPEHKPPGRAAAGPDAALQDKNAASGAQDHKDKAEAKAEDRKHSAVESLLNPDLIKKMLIFAAVQAAVIIILGAALVLVYLFWIKPATPVIW